MKDVMLNFKVPAEFRDRLAARAAEEMSNVSVLLRQIVKRYLDHEEIVEIKEIPPSPARRTNALTLEDKLILEESRARIKAEERSEREAKRMERLFIAEAERRQARENRTQKAEGKERAKRFNSLSRRGGLSALEGSQLLGITIQDFAKYAKHEELPSAELIEKMEQIVNKIGKDNPGFVRVRRG